jgi:3',5'-cyclic AMP phosphodiesterase CpdA
MIRHVAAAFLVLLVLCCSIASGVAAPAPTAGADTEGAFHFVVLSDRTGGHSPGVYKEVVNEINLLNPDFVVTVGDHIEGYGEDYDRTNAEWDSLLNIVDGLGAPVYFTPGNHDIWDDTSESIYIVRTGQMPYYSFDYGNTHFVVMDVSRIEYSSDLAADQMAWLVSDLASHQDAGNIFVFYHKPLWVNTLMVGKPDPLHEIFKEYGVDAVFNGHLHHYFATEFDGIEYTAMGSSGAEVLRSQPVPRGEFYQFGWMTVTPSDHELAIIDLGNIYPRDVVTTNDLGEIERIEGDLIRISELHVPENASARGPITVTVRNDSENLIDDVLTWDAPEAWSVEPDEAIVTVEPGASKTLTFMAMNSGMIFPAPHMYFRYPLSKGGTLDVDLTMPVKRTATARKFSAPPVIDGAVLDACWSECVPVTALLPGYDATVEGATRFLFGWDDENLYLAAVCRDADMDDVVANVTERDGPLFSEDCVGYFLQPDPDSLAVYQIYVNPAGAVFDQRITFDENMWYTADRDWNGRYDVAANRGEDQWSAEIRIPMSEIGADVEKGPVFGLNFRRKQARTGATADWQVPIDYDPGTFGELRLQ